MIFPYFSIFFHIFPRFLDVSPSFWDRRSEVPPSAPAGGRWPWRCWGRCRCAAWKVGWPGNLTKQVENHGKFPVFLCCKTGGTSRENPGNIEIFDGRPSKIWWEIIPLFRVVGLCSIWFAASDSFNPCPLAITFLQCCSFILKVGHHVTCSLLIGKPTHVETFRKRVPIGLCHGLLPSFPPICSATVIFCLL